MLANQLGIRYRRSPLSETPPGWPQNAPRAGDRFPWLRLKLAPNAPLEDLFAKFDDTRFNLLLIGQRSHSRGLSDYGGHVLIHRIPDDPVNDQAFVRARIPKPSFFLLRPDGYIGLAGTSYDGAAVTRYLNERVGLRNE
jgi:hypothetical protein